MRRKKLDGDISFQSRVASPIDFAHPAASNQRADLVNADHRSDRYRQAGSMLQRGGGAVYRSHGAVGIRFGLELQERSSIHPVALGRRTATIAELGDPYRKRLSSSHSLSRIPST